MWAVTGALSCVFAFFDNRQELAFTPTWPLIRKSPKTTQALVDDPIFSASIWQPNVRHTNSAFANRLGSDQPFFTVLVEADIGRS